MAAQKEAKTMKIVIPGGSGHLGTILAHAFFTDRHEVIVLSRSNNHQKASPWKTICWDGESAGAWVDELRGADAVINLAGRSVNCRYNRRNRTQIMESRVKSTKAIGDAIGRVQPSPRVWLQMSTATIYADRYDAPNDEQSGIIGGHESDVPDTWRFSIDVANAWEQTVDNAQTPRTRKVKLRSAMVMSPEPGGVFDTLLTLVRYGLGGQAGNGRQFVSWVHEQNFIRAIYWLIANEVHGAVNIAAPNPLPNRDFMQVLRDAWGIRFGLPAAPWMLGLGAAFMRSETELILKSRRVVPGVLLNRGFSFQFGLWRNCAMDLCSRWREMHSTRLPSPAESRTLFV
jgi:uncharacterized protein (TIGR01777 family)